MMRPFSRLIPCILVVVLSACSGLSGNLTGGGPGEDNSVGGGLQNAAMPGQSGGAPAPAPDRGEQLFACEMRLENASTPEENAAGTVVLRGRIPCEDGTEGSVCFSGRVLRLVDRATGNYLDAVSQGSPGGEAIVEWKWGSVSGGAPATFTMNDFNFFIAPSSETGVANASFQQCTGVGRCAPKDWGSVPLAKDGDNKSTYSPSQEAPAPPLPENAPAPPRPSGPIPKPSKN